MGKRLLLIGIRSTLLAIWSVQFQIYFVLRYLDETDRYISLKTRDK